jgi:phosphate-selective porin OprO and OprP
VTFTNVGFLGAMQAGQFKAPMSLEVLTSSRDNTFMEPAAPVQALAPGQNAGVQFSRTLFQERATWAFGFFTESVGQDYGDSSQNFGRAITRVTCLPLYEVDPGQPSSARLLHLGLSANVLYSGNSTVEYRSRPESHLAPYVVDTGDVAADGAFVAGAEAAWVQGPLSLQGEYLHSFVRETARETVNFGGFYVSACYFLTGESRPYDRRTGAWGRVIPKHNFVWGHGGWGAWEVAARLSNVDLGDGNIHGGRLTELMCGLNWYLHPHVKWRFNYGFGHVSEYYPAGNINIFQTRVDLDF